MYPGTHMPERGDLSALSDALSRGVVRLVDAFALCGCCLLFREGGSALWWAPADIDRQTNLVESDACHNLSRVTHVYAAPQLRAPSGRRSGLHDTIR